MGNSSEIDEMKGVEIAIIGMAGQFPGAPNVEVLWQNLHDGVESVTFFSEEELLAAGIDPVELNSSTYVRAAGVLEDIAAFDASFFGLTPREAEIMDPQHRLFLECAWTALENAGYTADHYPGLIGVYAGAGANSYLFNLYSHRDLLEFVDGLQLEIGNDRDFLTTFVSYKLNLKGPSVSIQTACSTSLVAVHLACQSLLHYECDMALAGGVSLAIPHRVGYLYQEGGINSPDGHCRAFDASARGTVRGSGVGLVVLKRLSDALADGDCIHAVIKGSAINNDGLDKVGYTAPSIQGQAEVIAAAQSLADIHPETISYIEAHGTGTALGDPIEVAALTQVFQASTRRTGFCALGSVKTNLGHLDAAAGIAGLLKVVLALKHRQLPPSLHFQQPNPELNLEASPFYINTTLRDWVSPTLLRAGISSFGMGGTNAHVVLEEAPPAPPASNPSRLWTLLVLSAKHPTALKQITARLCEHLERLPDAYPDETLADIAYTLQTGRKVFEHRRMLVCSDREEAIHLLCGQEGENWDSVAVTSQKRPVLFLFPGQGTQYVQMGRDLYLHEATFRRHIDQCAELLEESLGLDLRLLLYPSQEQEASASQKLQQTQFAQPALFTLEYALAQLWLEWGVHPAAMLGHSLGEYVVACLADVFSLEDALRLVAVRGQLMQTLPAGAMLSVALPEQQALLLTHQIDGLSLAAVNGPALCVLSGSSAAVERLQARLEGEEIACSRLHTSHAFHSALMDPILSAFAEQVRAVQLHAPKVPYLSNVTGGWITAVQATDPQYWVDHLRQPVRFAQGVQEALGNPHLVCLEVGPGETLTSMVRQCISTGDERIVLPSMRRPQMAVADEAILLTALGRLWLLGVQIDWLGFYAGERRRRVSLPTYPFEHQRYWVERQEIPVQPQPLSEPSHLSKKSNPGDWCYQPGWKRSSPLAAVARWQGEASTMPLRWLVYLDECGLGSQLVERLRTQGHLVVTVQQATSFSYLRAQTYAINPLKLEDYHRLLTDLHASGQLPQRILHLWTVTSEHASDQDEEPGTQEQKLERTSMLDLGFYSLLFLAQTLGTQALDEPLHLAVISTQLHSVTGEEHLWPEKATLLGPCKVIPQEYPTITCQSLDLSLPTEGDEQSQTTLVEALLGELSQIRAETVVAYRGQYRWVQTFEPIHLEPAPSGASRLRDQGVYLITGGLGGIGLVLGEALAQRVQARLALLGRHAFPRREEWKGWLESHGPEEAVSRKIQQLKRIEDMGSEVLVLQADVTDLEQMRAVLRKVQKHFGSLHGIVHAAGIAGGGMIQFRTPELAASVLASKVKGTQVLDVLCKDVPLDFFALCSSLSSISSGFGQIDYCAANAFLDAFAQYRTGQCGRFTVSINWDTWQEVGMAVNTQVPLDLRTWREESLKTGLLPYEGIEIFYCAIDSILCQVVVSTQDLQTVIEQSKASRATSPMKSLAQVSSSIPAYTRPSLRTKYVAPRNAAEQMVAAIWQELLGIERVGIHDDFFELGGHSLLAIHLFTRLQETFQVKLPLHHILEAPSIAELTKSIEQERQREQRSLPQKALIRIQPLGSKRPLFCMHPVGGNVLCYANLARHLGLDQPCYGLRAPGTEGEQEPYTQLVDMAKYYLEGIRSIQPQGPYLLGGWSLGSIVAFEVAQQLMKQSQEVALLVSIDMQAPTRDQQLIDDPAALLTWFAKDLIAQFSTVPVKELPISYDDLRQRGQEEQVRYVFEQARAVKALPSEIDFLQICHLLHVFRSNVQAMLSYVPQTYPGQLTLFRASDQLTEDHQNLTLGWERLVPKGVTVHMVPGDHYSLLKEPYVRILAQQMKECIDRG